MTDMKKRAILVVSAVTACAACSGASHVPKGPPPEYEDPPAADVAAAPSPSANPESVFPSSLQKASDATAE